MPVLGLIKITSKNWGYSSIQRYAHRPVQWNVWYLL